MPNQNFSPTDIVSATDGSVSVSDLRNWVRDDRFNTPLKEPRAGKPREFPIEAAYEAILLREFVAYGVPLETAKLWNQQILSEISKHGLADIAPSGRQSPPPKVFHAPQIVLFHRASPRVHILTDAEGGETLNKAFYVGRSGSGPAQSLAAIHLPSILSPLKRALGVTER